MIRHYDLATLNPEILKDFGFRKPKNLKGHWYWSDIQTFADKIYVFMSEINPEETDVGLWVFERFKPGPPPNEGIIGALIEEEMNKIEGQMREAGIINEQRRGKGRPAVRRMV